MVPQPSPTRLVLTLSRGERGICALCLLDLRESSPPAVRASADLAALRRGYRSRCAPTVRGNPLGRKMAFALTYANSRSPIEQSVAQLFAAQHVTAALATMYQAGLRQKNQMRHECRNPTYEQSQPP